MAAGRVRAWLLASSALVVAGAAPIPSLAANTTWTNSNATDVWSDNANWDTTAKPTGADDALITSVGTAVTAVTVNTDETANSVTVSNGNQVNISAGNTLSAGTVAINGGSTIQVGGSLSGTTTNAGTLNIGIGSTGGVLTGDVSNTGTLLFNRSDASAYSGIISGSGTVTKQGAGTLTLSGANTYSGGSTVSNGTVALNHIDANNLFDAVGTGGVTLDGGKLLGAITGSLATDVTFNAGKTSTIAAAAGTVLTIGGDPATTGNQNARLILGANAVAQFGSATDTGVVLVGASSTINVFDVDSTSQLVVAGGTLRDFQDQLFNLTAGVGRTTVNAGATLDFNDSFQQVLVNLNGAGSVTSGTTGTNTLTIFSTTGATNTFSGVISGSHPVSFNTTGGAATMILSGENTYTGGTTICSCGTLQLGDGGTTGSVLGDIDNEGTLIFNRSNSYTFNGVISDIGNVIQNGAGTTVLSADNTYSGGTTVNAGRLVVGNGGTTGSVAGNVTVASGAAFGVNRSDTYTVPNAISGAGGFVQLGTGTTIFDTAQAYTGDTTISAGTLQIGNGGVAGSLASTTIVDNGTLAINKSNSYGLAANISGTGGLNQIGAGTTSLTGANTYAGPTNVTAGILRAGAAGAFSPNSAFNVGALGTLNLSGFDQTIGSLAGSGPVLLSIATLTTGNDNTGTTYSGAIQGAGGLTKVGTGNFVLSGTSAYTGATTVNAGTLSVNGDISSSSVRHGEYRRHARRYRHAAVDRHQQRRHAGAGQLDRHHQRFRRSELQ